MGTPAVYLTIDEAADTIRVKPATLRLWLRGGRLKGYHAGGRWRIKPEDLEAFMEGSPPPLIPSPAPAAWKAEVLRRIRGLKAEGLTLQAIADRFNAEGLPTFSGKGKWIKGTISNLLKEEGED
jgi:excisionase family DNA binding protein